jgi:hypothetical protein
MTDRPFWTAVDDDQYAKLLDLTGQVIVHVNLWEESLLDEVDGDSGPTHVVFDLDLYLEGGVYFELYGAHVYASQDKPPLSDRDTVQPVLVRLVERRARLEEIAVDDEDALVLVLADERESPLYLVAGGWLLEEWDDAP